MHSGNVSRQPCEAGCAVLSRCCVCFDTNLLFLLPIKHVQYRYLPILQMGPATLVLVGTGMLRKRVSSNSTVVAFVPPHVSNPTDLSTVGSGKSTFAQALVQNSQSSWRRVNQDTLKSRGKCVTVAQQSLAASCNVIIDRMNFDTDQRAHWVKLAADFQSPCYALCLNYPADICAKRGAQRTRHEGGVTGEKARQLSVTMSQVIAGSLPCTHHGGCGACHTMSG